ncbi:G-protein coupled receptor Mth2 [Frankliniella fusca]|uniref:G-protein coupled receptor Mth2 n=1 Tax=Frankliniella fusca TaxID=407009 RepID=A0AAE1I386_9NEOP|nr:G-protein coupled receptor Mth2 [Frankliniella fusca]
MLWAKELSRKDCVRRSSWRSEVPEGAAGSLELPELLLDLYAEDNLKEATQSGVPVPAHWRTMVAERDNQTKGVFKLNQTHDPDDRFYLLEKNASLVVPNYAHSIFAPGTFCIDVFLVVRAGAGGPEGRWSVSAELSAIVPFVEDEEELAVSAIVSILYPVGLLISIPFLVATFAVYCSYSELRNLPGKSLMCYTASMIAGYLCLALVQFNVVVSNMVCVLLVESDEEKEKEKEPPAGKKCIHPPGRAVGRGEGQGSGRDKPQLLRGALRPLRIV